MLCPLFLKGMEVEREGQIIMDNKVLVRPFIMFNGRFGAMPSTFLFTESSFSEKTL